MLIFIQCRGFIKALLCIQILGVALPYDKLADVRARLGEISPTFDQPGQVIESGFEAQAYQLQTVSDSIGCFI